MGPFGMDEVVQGSARGGDLDELDEDAVGPFGMDKGDPGVIRGGVHGSGFGVQGFARRKYLY